MEEDSLHEKQVTDGYEKHEGLRSFYYGDVVD